MAYEDREQQYGEREVREVLEIREKLKEAARKKFARENSSHGTSLDRRISQFGSFFGSNEPSVADRVIQERKSLLETQHLASGASSHQKDSLKRKNVPNMSAPRNGMSDRRPVDPMKSKVQKIKSTRDYSFLDNDGDIPAAPKPSSSISNSVTRSAQVPLKSKECSQIHRNSLSNGHEGTRVVPRGSQVRPGHTQKVSSSLRPDSRRPDSGRPDFRRPETGRPDSRRPDSGRPDPRRPDSGRPDKSLQYRKPLSNGHAAGPGRPGMSRDISVKAPSSMGKKVGVGVTSMQRRGPDGRPLVKHSSSTSAVTNGQRAPVKPPNGVMSRNHMVERRPVQDSSKGKLLSKTSIPSSKSQVMRNPKPQMSSQRRLDEGPSRSKPKLKRKYSDEEEEAGFNVSSLIRNMFGYNPNKYGDVDDDVSDMEADYRTIQKEESRSARLAREEDERELLLIQQEEEREKRRKQAKRRRE